MVRRKSNYKIVLWQESGKTSYLRGIKGHQTVRTWVFIDCICVTNNGCRAVSVSRNGNGDCGGLVTRAVHPCKDETKGHEGKCSFPMCPITSSKSSLALCVPRLSLVLELQRTRKSSEFASMWLKDRTEIALDVPWTQFISCDASRFPFLFT